MACKNETSIALLRSDNEKLLLGCINVENENKKLRQKWECGRKTIIHSDYKPLEVILKKPLYKAPKRLQDDSENTIL